MCSYNKKKLLVLAYEFLINKSKTDMTADLKSLKVVNASVKHADSLLYQKGSE